MYEPEIDTEKCIKCGKCLSMCPKKSNEFDENTQNPLTGKVLESYCAKTKDLKKLELATSGGCVTTIVEKMLQLEMYECAFLVDSYHVEKLLETKCYIKGMSLDNVYKSRYLPVCQSGAIKFMIQHPDKKVILVGTSCFVKMIESVIREYHLNRENYLILGLFCDQMMTYNVGDYLNKVFWPYGKIDYIYFRNKKQPGGWPGKFEICFQSGKRLTKPSRKRMLLKKYFECESCIYCFDKLNQLADISFGDNYIKKKQDPCGSNTIIVRTRRGQKSWDAVKDEFVWQKADMDEIAESQKINKKKLNEKFSRYKYQKEKFDAEEYKKYLLALRNIKKGENKRYIKIYFETILATVEILFQKAAFCIQKRGNG